LWRLRGSARGERNAAKKCGYPKSNIAFHLDSMMTCVKRPNVQAQPTEEAGEARCSGSAGAQGWASYRQQFIEL
jgi:hypothetical protein